MVGITHNLNHTQFMFIWYHTIFRFRSHGFLIHSLLEGNESACWCCSENATALLNLLISNAWMGWEFPHFVMHMRAWCPAIPSSCRGPEHRSIATCCLVKPAVIIKVVIGNVNPWNIGYSHTLTIMLFNRLLKNQVHEFITVCIKYSRAN